MTLKGSEKMQEKKKKKRKEKTEMLLQLVKT